MKLNRISISFLILHILIVAIYTFGVTFIGSIFFKDKAEGNLVIINEKIRGSILLAQKTISNSYFWPRPSATDYVGIASGASNKGPISKDLIKEIESRKLQFSKFNKSEIIPQEMLLASASGLDPHISLNSAIWQLDRISKTSNFDIKKNNEIKHELFQLIEYEQLGFLGVPRLNVLKLNLMLDQLKSKKN